MHYVSKDWTLGMSNLIVTLSDLIPHTEEVLIDFQELVGEHSGENMATTVWKTLTLYGLKGRVSSKGHF